ncbi:MAG: S8 family serine peptidase [Euryarchaeota archaeon]|nr:S8 family serine peptidase [Euryarchaeota archaeon]
MELNSRTQAIVIASALLTASATGVLATLLEPQAPAGVSPELAEKLSSSSQADRLPIVIQFKDSVRPSDALLLQDLGFTGLIQYEMIPAVYGVGDVGAIETLRQSPRVEYIEYDTELEYYLDTATTTGRAKQVWDAAFNTYLGGVREAHEGGFTGSGVNIAIIDTGVDATHQDLLYAPLATAAGLPGKTSINLKLLGRDSVSGDVFNPNDPNGMILDGAVEDTHEIVKANALAVPTPNSDNTGSHGTHVAGIAGGSGAASGGVYKGAAPGANIVGLGCGETIVIHLGLAGFDWVYANADAENIRIVSNSWGGAGDWNPDSALTKAIQKLAQDKGTIILFAAGNDGGDGSLIRTNLWANIPEVTLSVANYNEAWGFANNGSSRGKIDLERTWPDLMATGTRVRSTAAILAPLAYSSDESPPTPVVDPYTTFTGTSMATPFVAGVVALMLEANPALTAADVKEILRDTSKPVTYLNATGVSIVTSYATHGYAMGKGLSDASAAVAAALRMADGHGRSTAIRLADVDSSVSPWVLNPPRPIADVTSPSSGSILAGTAASVAGTATTYGDPVTLVEVSVDSGPWSAATGTGSWSFTLDTTSYSDGVHAIAARAFDGSVYSFADSVNVIINNGIDPPTPVLMGPTGPAIAGTSVGFDGSLSTADPGRSIVSYAWDFGDGGTAAGPVASHAFTAPGTYSVTLTVTDDGSLFGSEAIDVKVLERHDLFLHAGNAMDPTMPTAGEDTVETHAFGESVAFISSGFGGQTLASLHGRIYLSTSGENPGVRLTNALFNVSWYSTADGVDTQIGFKITQGAFVLPTDATLRTVELSLSGGFAVPAGAELRVKVEAWQNVNTVWRIYFDSAAHASEIVALTAD